jgi:hypothetical protein
MRELKYIIFEDNSFILFDTCQKHSEACMRSDIKSAGFCSITFYNDEVTITCYGESISLKKKSNENDSRIIRVWLTGEF